MSVATHVSGDWMVHAKSKSTKQDKEEATKELPSVWQRRGNKSPFTKEINATWASSVCQYPYPLCIFLANIIFVFIFSSEPSASSVLLTSKQSWEASKETASFFLTIFQGKLQFSIVIRLPLDFLTETSTRIICNQSTRHAQRRRRGLAGVPVSASCT